MTLEKTAIDLSSVHAGTTPAATKLIEVDKAPSAMSNSMLVDKIQIKKLLSTGVADRYLATLEVSFKGTVRNQVPISLQKIIVTNSADPIGNKRIVDCLGVGTGGSGRLIRDASFPEVFSSAIGSGTYNYKPAFGTCMGSGAGSVSVNFASDGKTATIASTRTSGSSVGPSGTYTYNPSTGAYELSSIGTLSVGLEGWGWSGTGFGCISASGYWAK